MEVCFAHAVSACAYFVGISSLAHRISRAYVWDALASRVDMITGTTHTASIGAESVAVDSLTCGIARARNLNAGTSGILMESSLAHTVTRSTL